jgi:hypothetical protein
MYEDQEETRKDELFFKTFMAAFKEFYMETSKEDEN